MQSEQQAIPPKKEALLSAGKKRILTKGFTATTVDEICADAGITKGAFYYFFKSKEAFAGELLEYNWQPIQAMRAQLENTETDPLQHLHQHIDFMVSFLPGDGRLIGVISQELSETNPGVGEQVRGYFRQWTAYLQQIVEVTKAQYAPDADFAPQGVMEFIILTIEGVPVVARQLGPDAVDRSIVHLKNYLNTLFGAV